MPFIYIFPILLHSRKIPKFWIVILLSDHIFSLKILKEQDFTLLWPRQCYIFIKHTSFLLCHINRKLYSQASFAVKLKICNWTYQWIKAIESLQYLNLKRSHGPIHSLFPCETTLHKFHISKMEGGSSLDLWVTTLRGTGPGELPNLN